MSPRLGHMWTLEGEGGGEGEEGAWRVGWRREEKGRRGRKWGGGEGVKSGVEEGRMGRRKEEIQ